jgi:hypothetical protein
MSHYQLLKRGLRHGVSTGVRPSVRPSVRFVSDAATCVTGLERGYAAGHRQGGGWLDCVYPPSDVLWL